MGIVIRQGLKSTALQYAGVAIGFVANLFLYTAFRDEYGLIQVLIAAANLIVPFAMLGSFTLAVRFYPRVGKEEAAQNGFLTLLLGITTAGLLLYLLVSPFLQDWLLAAFEAKTKPEYRVFLNYVPGLVALFAYIKILYQYTVNFRLIVVPTFLEQFLLKLSLPALILAFSLGFIGVGGIVAGVFVNYLIALLGLLGYLTYMGRFHLKKLSKVITSQAKDMAEFAAYGIAGTLGSSFAFGIDTILVGSLLGLDEAGIYAIVRFMSEVISKPYVNLRTVLSPQISAAWSANDPQLLDAPYKSSSINLLLTSAFVFGGIVVCFESVTELARDGEFLWIAFPAFVLLGLSRLIDAATSVNEYIISFSPKFRFNLVALLLLAGINIWLNYLLIPIFGLTGAALATLISLAVYNLAKLLFAGWSFGLWPFTTKTIEVVVVMGILIAAVFFLPRFEVWWLDIPVRGGLFSAFVFCYVRFFPASPEIEKLLATVLQKVGLSKLA